jgi:hypothetical protein
LCVDDAISAAIGSPTIAERKAVTKPRESAVPELSLEITRVAA